jgi:hypothetical protein
MTRNLSRVVLAGMSLVAVTGALAARPGQGDRVGTKGRIDYEKGMVYATGLGAVSSKEPNEAKAYLRGRGFAKLDALRNLLGVIDHVKIDSRTTGKDYEAISDEIRAEVQGIVRGASIVSEREIRVGRSTMVEVTVVAPLFGEDGLASVFLPKAVERAAEARIEPLPQTQIEIKRPPVEVPIIRDREPEIRPVGKYTSVIIDARGLGVERCMSPKIRRADGSELWGTLSTNLDFVIEHGIVAYARTMNEAMENKRAGGQPLVLHAIGRAGGKFNSDAVLSDADAELLERTNERAGFLGKFNVIFVVDPGR